jgi:hypothetical protein
MVRTTGVICLLISAKKSEVRTMGGFGSGRSGSGGKDCTDDMRVLDYRQRSRGGEWQNATYPARLDWTPCHFGGERAWWRCPAVGCGRRVALLSGSHQVIY